jgi:hypothetical protein
MKERRHSSIRLVKSVEVGGVSSDRVLERFKLHCLCVELSFQEVVRVAFERIVMDRHVVAEVVEVELNIQGL